LLKSIIPRLPFIFIGILLGLGLYTFYYAKGYAYLSNDPKACIQCHIMNEQFDGWQKASHHNWATCNDCHIPHSLLLKYLRKGENGFWHSLKFTTQNFHEPIQIRQSNVVPLQRNCQHCHQDIVNDINISAHGSKKELSCLHCHAQVGHGAQKP